MKFIKANLTEVEATYDPSVVKFNRKFYVIFSQLGSELTLALRSEFDSETETLLNLIVSTDELIKNLKEIKE